MEKKVKKFDKVKEIKRMSREFIKICGKGGPHRFKKERKMKTDDYLEELEEDSLNKKSN